MTHRLCSFLIVMIAAAAAFSVRAEGPVPDLEAVVRALTLERADKDPAAITRDDTLTRIAREHSRTMHRARRLSHQLGGIGPEQRLAREHRSLFGLVAENVAMQQGALSEENVALRLLEGWMNSPGHRANILSPYDTFEVGCYGDGRTVYCTQLFVRETTRLAHRVDFRQPASGELTVELADEKSRGRRMSLAPAQGGASDEGVVIHEGVAQLALPQRPGLYQLKLWFPHQDDPTRFRIIGGPYLCVVAAATSPGREPRLPRSCRPAR